MQVGSESYWNQETHPAHRSFAPWVGKTVGDANEKSFPMYPEKDIRLFQSANMDNSIAYDPPRKYLFSELPSSASYLPNTSYNKSSQSLSATKYGSNVRKIQDLLQEMEQDEEQRLAQMKRDELLLNPNYDQRSVWPNNAEKRNLLSATNRSGSLGRHKSSPGLNSIYTHELQSQDRRRSCLSKARPFELEVPYGVMSKISSDNGSSEVQPIELEVPSSGITDVATELYVPYTGTQPQERLQADSGSQPQANGDPMSSFADIDLMISNSRSFYKGNRSSVGSVRRTSLSSSTGRNHRSSRSTLSELDASPLNLVAELPTENYQLSPVEQRNIPPSRYGDRKFRTLPGEAFPLIERELPSRTEQELQKMARVTKQNPTPLA